MRKDKSAAIALRKSGKSYNFISSKLDIPKSTLSEWLSGIDWSEAIKIELTADTFRNVLPKFKKMAELNRKRWKLWRSEARKEAVKQFNKFQADTLFCSGIMLYWGEGDKNPKNPVRISNVDPRLLKIFVKFLKQFGGITREKIKIHVILYPDLDEDVCKNYWVSHVGIPSKYFYKTQYIKGRHATRRLGYGICVVSVRSGQLKEKILKWIELYSKM